MFEIKVSQEIKNACPVFAGAAVYAAVKNTAYCDGLWKEINSGYDIHKNFRTAITLR